MPVIREFTAAKQALIKKYKDKERLFVKAVDVRERKKHLAKAIIKAMEGKRLNELEKVAYGSFLRAGKTKIS